MEQPQRRLAALKEDRFGDLDLKPIRREAAVGERTENGLVERAAMELDRRNVDGDTDVLRPVRRLLARLAHHPRTDRNDEAGIFGDRNEIGGRDQTTLGMLPAEQRFERANAILLEVE